VWIRIHRLDFVPLARISGAVADARAEDFLDRDLSDDLATLLREMQADHALGRRFASIVDLTGAPPLNAKQRAVVGAWIKETRDLSRQTSISIAFVAPSTLLRGVLTAIFWVQSFGFPQRVSATLDDAITWSLERIRETGQQVPPGAQEAVLRAFQPPAKQATSARAIS
jgi:hypothetical protein